MEVLRTVYSREWVQFIALLLCFGSGILATDLSLSTANMQFGELLATLINGIGEGTAEISLINDFFLPTILFLTSCFISLSLAIHNAISLRSGRSIDYFLKVLLGLSQLAVFVYFLILGFKLLLFGIGLSLAVFSIYILLLFLLSSGKRIK